MHSSRMHTIYYSSRLLGVSAQGVSIQGDVCPGGSAFQGEVSAQGGSACQGRGCVWQTPPSVDRILDTLVKTLPFRNFVGGR